MGDISVVVGEVNPSVRATGDSMYASVFSRKAASESSLELWLDEDTVAETRLLGVTIRLRFQTGGLRPRSSMSSQPDRSGALLRTSSPVLMDKGTTIAGAWGRCSGKLRLSLSFFHPEGAVPSEPTAVVATENRDDSTGEGSVVVGG